MKPDHLDDAIPLPAAVVQTEPTLRSRLASALARLAETNDRFQRAGAVHAALPVDADAEVRRRAATAIDAAHAAELAAVRVLRELAGDAATAARRLAADLRETGDRDDARKAKTLAAAVDPAPAFARLDARLADARRRYREFRPPAATPAPSPKQNRLRRALARRAVRTLDAA